MPKFENQDLFSKKVVAKPGSCPRPRRRSRQDRNQSKIKRPEMPKEANSGTTIIVIQKSEETEGNYNTTSFDKITNLEDILRIAEQRKSKVKLQYRSQGRLAKDQHSNSQSKLSKTQKRKPPLQTLIPREFENESFVTDSKEHNSITKTYSSRHLNSNPNKNLSNTSSKSNFNEDQQTAHGKSELPRKIPKRDNPYLMKRIDELIQQKKEALGIKPLESALSNYKAVLGENAKLQKLVEDQK